MKHIQLFESHRRMDFNTIKELPEYQAILDTGYLLISTEDQIHKNDLIFAFPEIYCIQKELVVEIVNDYLVFGINIWQSAPAILEYATIKFYYVSNFGVDYRRADYDLDDTEQTTHSLNNWKKFLIQAKEDIEEMQAGWISKGVKLLITPEERSHLRGLAKSKTFGL